MVAVIIVAAIAIIGGLGFVFFGNATGGAAVSKEREELEAQAAGNKYNQYTGGQMTTGDGNSGTKAGPPGGEAEARARMGGGTGSGN